MNIEILKNITETMLVGDIRKAMVNAGFEPKVVKPLKKLELIKLAGTTVSLVREEAEAAEAAAAATAEAAEVMQAEEAPDSDAAALEANTVANTLLGNASTGISIQRVITERLRFDGGYKVTKFKTNDKGEIVKDKDGKAVIEEGALTIEAKTDQQGGNYRSEAHL